MQDSCGMRKPWKMLSFDSVSPPLFTSFSAFSSIQGLNTAIPMRWLKRNPVLQGCGKRCGFLKKWYRSWVNISWKNKTGSLKTKGGKYWIPFHSFSRSSLQSRAKGCTHVKKRATRMSKKSMSIGVVLRIV